MSTFTTWSWLGRRVPEECPKDVVNLWRSCVARDPGARPSAAEVQAALEALLPLQRPQQAQPAAPPADSTGASASSASAVSQPRTPPQVQEGAVRASRAVVEQARGEQSAAGVAGAVLELPPVQSGAPEQAQGEQGARQCEGAVPAAWEAQSPSGRPLLLSEDRV